MKLKKKTIKTKKLYEIKRTLNFTLMKECLIYILLQVTCNSKLLFLDPYIILYNFVIKLRSKLKFQIKNN